METENTQRELDLIDLIKICWGWFVSYIFKPCVFLLKFVFVRWWIGLIGIVLGVGLAVIISTFYPKYIGTIIFENNVGSSSDFVNDTRALSKSSPESISKLLNVPLDQAMDVLAVWPHLLFYRDTLRTSFYVDMGEVAPIESSALQNKFCVEIKAQSLSAFNGLQEGLVAYYSSNEYFVKEAEANVNALRQSAQVAQEEVAKLDAVRDGSPSKKGVIFSGDEMHPMYDPAEISRERIKLSEISVSTQNALKYNTAVVSVVSPLKVMKVPINYFVFTAPKYTAAFVFLFYAIALVIVYRKKIFGFLKQ